MPRCASPAMWKWRSSRYFSLEFSPRATSVTLRAAISNSTAVCTLTATYFWRRAQPRTYGSRVQFARLMMWCETRWPMAERLPPAAIPAQFICQPAQAAAMPLCRAMRLLLPAARFRITIPMKAVPSMAPCNRREFLPPAARPTPTGARFPARFTTAWC